jgi:hypothetical protein
MYAWSSDTPKTMSIINTTKKEMMSVHGVDSKDTDEVVMKHQYIRNNSKNQDRAMFYSPFNSNVISLDPLVQGVGSVRVKVAMPYPAEYNHKQNWFETNVNL